MSQGNVEIARRSVNEWNAFMRGDLSSEALGQLFDVFRHRADALQAAGLRE